MKEAEERLERHVDGDGGKEEKPKLYGGGPGERLFLFWRRRRSEWRDVGCKRWRGKKVKHLWLVQQKNKVNLTYLYMLFLFKFSLSFSHLISIKWD